MDNKTFAAVRLQTKVRQRQSLTQSAQRRGKRTSLNWLGNYRAAPAEVEVSGEDRGEGTVGVRVAASREGSSFALRGAWRTDFSLRQNARNADAVAGLPGCAFLDRDGHEGSDGRSGHHGHTGRAPGGNGGPGGDGRRGENARAPSNILEVALTPASASGRVCASWRDRRAVADAAC